MADGNRHSLEYSAAVRTEIEAGTELGTETDPGTETELGVEATRV